MLRRIVLGHEVIALFGLIKRDAEQLVSAEDLGAVVEPGRQCQLRQDENGSIPPELGIERQRLLMHPATNKRPPLGHRCRIVALQIARHHYLLLRPKAGNGRLHQFSIISAQYCVGIRATASAGDPTLAVYSKR